MRVLALSEWYPPEPDVKIHDLNRDLVARGHAVTAVTGFPNYPTGRLAEGYRIRWRQWEERDGVRVLRLPLYPDHSRSGARRALNYLSFAASATVLGPALSGPADVMWVYHPPLTVGLPAWWLGLVRRVPFVYAIHDMWPETVAATGMLTHPIALELLGAMALGVYRQAAAITVVSPGFKRNLIDKGVAADKVHVIPNWADEELYRPVPRDRALAAEHGLEGRFNVVYGGNMGAAQAMENVLAAAALVRDLRDLQIVLIGDGVDVASLQARARSLGLANVRFVPRQPAARMPAFFALGDVLLAHLKRDPLFTITIPSKTISYLACGRPILTVTEGDAADVVRDAGAGWVCPPEDPHALARALRDVYAMDPAAREDLGAAGRRAFLAHYTRSQLMDRYESLLRDVAARRGRT